MKKTTSPEPIFFYGPLLIAVCSACILLQAGCNNAGGQQKTTAQQEYSDQWITMNLTFKPNTSKESREKAIKHIEEMWMKDAAPFMKEDKNLFPTISLTRFSPLDTLKYRLSLLNTHFNLSSSGEPTSLPTIKAARIPCPPCPGLCIQCDSTKSLLMKSYGIAKMTFEELK